MKTCKMPKIIFSLSRNSWYAFEEPLDSAELSLKKNSDIE